jgi:hypothetical protein
VTARIEQLCKQLTGTDFTERAARYGATAPLARIIAAMRAGAELNTVEADLDALDDAFARHGIDDVTSSPRAYRALPGPSGHPVLHAWVCPARQRCPRQELGNAAQGKMCALTGMPLTGIDVPL